jgi:sugar/nucleoside kinase (ribokinase family)
MISPSHTRFDYVTVGHVTRDQIEDGTDNVSFQPGGSAFYSALQAARLGLRTLILTKGIPSEIEALLGPYLDEFELQVIPAQQTTTLSTRGTGATRTQHVLAWAGAIVEPMQLDTAILHLAPIARETPVSWGGCADFIGITPQGLIRHWGQSKDISLVQLDPALLPHSFDAAVLSEHERESCHSLFSAAYRCDAPIAITAGSMPTSVHLPVAADESIVQTILPPQVLPRDDLGAGDVFAAAFFIALSDGRDPLQAAAFANAAAAIRIAGTGPDAIGRSAAIIP